MKILKPDYYDTFACSADQCSYTCCQEWTIAVDEKHKEEWKALKLPPTVKGVSGFSGKNHLSDLTKRTPDGTVLDMGSRKICPFLNEEKLCEIVLAYGEEAISHTCHTFPRKCQRYENRLEYALDLGCPTALELLWKKGAFSLEETEAEGTDSLSASMKELAEVAEKGEKEESLLFLIREKAMQLIAREDIPLSKSWIMLFGIMLDFYEREESLTEAYVETMFQAAFLEQLKETVMKAGRDPIDHFTERNELFLDLAYNYTKKGLYKSVIGEITDRAHWFEMTDDGYTYGMMEEFAPEWEKLEPKIRLIMLEGIYSGMLLPGGSLYSMVMKVEWLGILLSAMQHGVFLRYELDEAMMEEKIPDILVVLQRMTGYSEADIEEYLENSFQQVIWDWGYMALIV